jgi:hypothetical protein
MKIVLDENPFADKEPNHTYAFFLPEASAAEALHDIRGRIDEEVRMGRQRICGLPVPTARVRSRHLLEHLDIREGSAGQPSGYGKFHLR